MIELGHCLLSCSSLTHPEVFTVVTDRGSVFKSWTKRTEDDKLSWSFGWLNYESRNMGYVAEQHFHTRQALVWDKATVQF
jgi:hypothetical protein